MTTRGFLSRLIIGLAILTSVRAATSSESSFAPFAKGLPAGWGRFGAAANGEVKPVALPGGGQGALLRATRERVNFGLNRQFKAQPGKYYRVTLESSALPGHRQAGTVLQLRFAPYPLKTYGNSEYLHQEPLADYDEESNLTEVVLKAPDGTTGVAVNLIATDPAAAVRLHRLVFEESDAPLPPRKADPRKVPGTLEQFGRDWKLETALVRDGKAAAVLVIPDRPEYRELAAAVNRAVKEKTGLELPVRSAAPYRTATTLKEHAIVIGSRDVNAFAENLYNRYYTVIDRSYPGPGGAVARSLHDPFGGGGNVLLAAGSDFAGDRLAVEKLVRAIGARPAGKSLALGYLADISLGTGLTPPESARAAKIWDESPGNPDGFGWTLLSKNLALFYLTGDEKFAREFLRLAFPDEAASRELNEADGAFTYNDLKNPLGNPYHYNSSMLILHWDLVEEHPFFSDADRERVIAKLYEQLNRRRTHGDKGIYKIYNIKTPPVQMPDRHWVSEALTVYIAARYFDKYYPAARDGRDGLAAARRQFATLDHYAAMNAGSLFWYNSYLLPILDYALLDGGVKYVNSPVIDRYVEALTLLADRTPGDWSQRFSSYRLLNLMGYLTQNRAPVEPAEAREAFDAGGLRLGQSFRPAAPYPNDYFADTDGKWRIARFDERGMPDWQPPFARDKVVEWMSFRRHGAAGDDFLLLDAKYESGRNAFHNFALINLVLRGVSLLRGYHNQLHLYMNGLGDPAISRFTEILDAGRVGDTAFVRGRLANFNGYDWERTLLLRENRFLLQVDTVTPLADYAASQIIVNFETAASARALPVPAADAFEIRPRGAEPWTFACSLPGVFDQVRVPGGANLQSSGVNSQISLLLPGRKDVPIRFASVLRPGPAGDAPSTAQEGDTVALRLPEPALLKFQAAGGFLLEEENRRFGFRMTAMPGVFTASVPVTADFDAGTNTLRIVAADRVELTFADGRRETVEPGTEAVFSCAARPSGVATEQAEEILAARPRAGAAAAEYPEIAADFREKLGSFVGVVEPVTLDGEALLAVAVDRAVLLLSGAGQVRRRFECSDVVGSICFDPARRRLLIGSKDEKLRAFSLDGEELWSFTSAMPDGVKHERMWWAKGEMPGVCKIAVVEFEPGQPRIFVGGASTLEILDGDGKLLKRHFQEWGTFEGFTPLPARKNKPAEMLSWGYMVGHPSVYVYGPKLARGYLNLATAKDGTWFGSFGFGYVGRQDLRVARLAPGGPELLVGNLNGVINRVMVWDLDGKVLHEADLGFGSRAFGGIPYGRTMLRGTNIRGFELPDFAGDGRRSIAVAFQRKFVIAFDEALKVRFFCPLPEQPLLLAVAPGAAGDRLAAACADGSVCLIGGEGRIAAVCRVEGRPTMLAAVAGRLLVGTDRGELYGFSLP